MARKRYRKWYHIPLQPPIDVRVGADDGEPLVFDEDTNKFEPSESMVLQQLIVDSIDADSIDTDSIDTDYVDFNLLYAGGTAEGRLQWNVTDGTLEVGMPGGVVNLQIGQENLIRARNVDGAQLDDGTAVWIFGASGANPTVKHADPGTFEEAAVVGVVTEDVANNQFGYVTTFGLVRNLNTVGCTAGLTVWLTSGGAFTTTRPTPGAGVALVVGIGVCLREHASEGVVFVNPYIVPRLIGLSDVLGGVPVTGDILQYSGTNTRFQLSQNASEKSWSFESLVGSTGTVYYGGFYEFFSGNNDFTVAQNLGTANVAKAAHVSLILGELAVDEITIRVAGTSITDAGVRIGADTEDIVIPDASAVDSYFETAKKWNGLVTITLISGTAKQCNYGFAKYWDNNNTDFTVRGLEVTWLAGASDANPNIQLLHHQQTGWTYNVGAEPTPPTAIADMAVTYGAEKQLADGEHGSFKRADLDVDVDGSTQCGTLWAITNSANRAFEQGDILMRITPR